MNFFLQELLPKIDKLNNIGEIKMKWKNKLKKTVQYSGTCRRCGEFIPPQMATQVPCPLNLPAQDVTNPLTRSVNCPMKVPVNQ